MHISHHHRFAYFASPRTASNSVQSSLILSGVSHETDIIYDMSGVNLTIEFDDITKLGTERYAYNAKKIREYHTTPTQAIEQNLLTIDQLIGYTSFGFVREPLERWVSCFFVGYNMGYMPSGSNPAEVMNNMIETGNIEPWLGLTDLQWKARDYFTYEDKVVVSPYRFDNLELTLQALINHWGGDIGSIPVTDIFDTGTPERFKQPIETFVSQSNINILKDYFADDIMFYQTLK